VTRGKWRWLGAIAPSALLALVCTGCGGFTRWPWSYTQRWPGPMKAESTPLPPGDRGVFAEGPEEALVLRHADPCQVRPAGLVSSYPLTFYKKQQHLRAGSSVYTAAGGRLELLWPSGTSITLFGRGMGIIGSPSRGEPSFLFQQVERAHVSTAKPEAIQIAGGVELRVKGGPVLLDSLRADLLRVLNQSKGAIEVAYRDVVFELDPGEKVDLPIVLGTGAPSPAETGWSQTDTLRMPARYRGAVDVESSEAALVLRSNGENVLEVLGQRIRLPLDEELRVEGLESLTPPARKEPVKP
jgi:hypothetical protein